MLLNPGSAQVANPNSTPDSSTTTTSVQVTTSQVTSPTGVNEAPVVLSPFEVASTQDTGYRARNTLAGSRISTDLKDLAGPITVVTKDFIDDIGAVDVNDILTYEVGTEGTKDFSSNTTQLGRTSDNAAQDPNASTRGRGLAAFDITRDYFYSLTVSSGVSVGFDSYNLDNVTIVRGADSILAGLGSPAGIINYAPQLAMLDRSTNDVSYRFGSYGDKRAIVNSNIVAKEGVLAFRVAGVWNDKGFEQKPSYDREKRYYLATTWKPFTKTTVHASYESVNLHAKYPNTFTPEDDISQWIALGKPVPPPPISGTVQSSPIPNSNAVFYAGTDQGTNVYFKPDGSLYSIYNDSGIYAYAQQNLSNVGIWQPLRFSNDQYGDWHKLNINGTHQDTTLSTESISVDQEILPGLNLNGSFLHEILNSAQLGLGRPDYVADYIDVNPTLPWGAPNPYYGDTYMYFAGLDNKQHTTELNRVARATATYDLDLTKFNKWFGRYVFTGFVEDRKTTSDYTDFSIVQAGNGGTATGFNPGAISYTGGTPANGYFTSAVASPPILQTDGPVTNSAGATTDNFTTQYLLKAEQKSITKLNTSAFVLQAYLLDNLAVGTFGIRRDKDVGGYLNTTGVDSASGLVNPLPDGEYANTLSTVQAQTKTYGVVLHGPKIGNVNLKWLSVGYSQSENFIPNAGSEDLLGNATPDPSGKTKDYSISVDMLDGKLNARIDWFTSIAANADAPTVNFPLVQWSIPFISLVNNNVTGLGAYADLARQVGFTGYSSGIAPGITTGSNALANAYTADTQSKGMEFELTYNVTRNWRVFGTVTREQAEQSNIAPALTTFINQRVAYWQANGLWNGPVTTTKDWCNCPETGQQVFNNDVLGPFVAYQSAAGQPSQQLHKWKASLVTNYTIDKGIAKGLGIGTGVRWFDKTIIGNPAIYTTENGVPTVTGLDLAHPYTVPGQTSVEAWVTYSRKIFDDKYLLSFRLEADNLESGGGYMPVNANSDGTHQLFKIMPPRTYYFTTELKF